LISKTCLFAVLSSHTASPID